MVDRFFGTFFTPKAFKVLINVQHRLNYFTKLIKQHKEELDNPERGHDLMYEFLLERRKQLENGNHKTTFTGI